MSHWSEMNRRSQGIALRREDYVFLPMVYRKDTSNPEIIARGTYMGMQYVVANIGPRPCAYVICPKEFLDRFTDEYGQLNCDINVHGGVTYVGEIGHLKACVGLKGYCFGWDYGHIGDWDGSYSNESNELYHLVKYTTEMLVKDCKDAIEQYQEIVKTM